jgi:alpha-beta hydrolase superfamily lysophospholipase
MQPRGKHRTPWRWAALMLLTCSQLTAAAQQLVSLEIKPGIAATAAYWPGENGLPPVVIVHGFLQTREFPTVRRLAEALAESGYPVLTPTLSLGIDDRRQSLACEAIHTHDMNGDVAELTHWVDWLARETRRRPILIGHSSGNLALLGYLARHTDPPVSETIMISLTYFGQGPAANETPADAERALADLARGQQVLGEYALNYCQKYVATPASFLSYYVWSKDRTVESVKSMKVPTSVIIGDADRRIDRDWMQILQAHSLNVIAVEGANHFFDQQHEFDLLDAIEGLLADAAVQPTD